MDGNNLKNAGDNNKPKIVRKRNFRGAEKQPVSLGKVSVNKQYARTQRPSLLQFTFIVLYKKLYILGITLLRRRLRIMRGLKLFFKRMRGAAYAGLERQRQAISQTWVKFIKRFRAPFLLISNTYKEQKPIIHEKRLQGKIAFSSYFAVAEMVFRLIFKIVRTIFNYTVPIVAAMYLITTINSYLNQPLGLMVEYKGKQIGYIRNESEFDAATLLVKGRVIADSEVTLSTEPPVLTLQVVAPERLMKTSDLADKIIEASGNDIEQAYGLYIDNKFYGAVANSDYLYDTMMAIKRQNASGKENERIEFLKKIALTPALYPRSSLVDEEGLAEMIRSYETVDQKYTVEEGDSPTLIAQKMDIPYEELKQRNPGIEEKLAVGDELLIDAAQPFLSVKSIFTDEYEEEFSFKTIEVENATYARGYRLVTQEGQNGVQKVKAEITTMNGIETGREILETSVIKAAVDERVTVGVNNPQNIQSSGGLTSTDRTPSGAASSSGFIWPTAGGVAKTYSNHSGNGVDIAVRAGVPIYASAAGTVEVVKYGRTGYGNYIIINHGNGYSTLYAHNSELYVKVGDVVGQGQVIAAMGRTGWATGNHLHFEVRYNGRYMWPVDYIGSHG